MYWNRQTRFKIVGNYLFFFIGSFGKSSVFWFDTQKSKNAPFAVILETISKNEIGLYVWNTYFRTLPENIWKKIVFQLALLLHNLYYAKGMEKILHTSLNILIK